MKASREAVASALSSLGYKVNRFWKFAARDERTPSAQINADGSIHDFGNDFHGDLPDFMMEYCGKQKGEALKLSRELLMLPIEFEFKNYSKTVDKKEGFISDDFIANFTKERKDNFGRYLELLDLALPALTRPEQKAIAQKYTIGYSKQGDRLIMPIRDEEGRCVTFWKYNKFPKTYIDDNGKEVNPSKVTFTSGRKRTPFNLQDLKKYSEDKNGWILFCEGEKDTLNALGKGYRAVTLGGTSERIKPEHLHHFKGLKFIIVYDYDESGNGAVYGITNKQGIYEKGVLAQLQEVAAEVKVWDWELLAFQEGFELYKGFDFTDWLCTKEIKGD